MKTNAVISTCGAFRYRLSRTWDQRPPLLFVMLNPSTADASLDDPTIRRCISFAKAHDHGGIEVVNLFAYRATDPRDLKAAGYQIGPDNDMHIRAALAETGTVCVAWGDRARNLARPLEVLQLIALAGRVAHSLAETKHGLPSHPLMLSASCRLHPYPPREPIHA